MNGESLQQVTAAIGTDAQQRPPYSRFVTGVAAHFANETNSNLTTLHRQGVRDGIVSTAKDILTKRPNGVLALGNLGCYQLAVFPESNPYGDIESVPCVTLTRTDIEPIADNQLLTAQLETTINLHDSKDSIKTIELLDYAETISVVHSAVVAAGAER